VCPPGAGKLGGSRTGASVKPPATESHPGRLVDPAQCSPDDILVYLTSHWLQHHGRQVMEGGGTQPAPNTLASMLGHLSTRLQELGRRGVVRWAGRDDHLVHFTRAAAMRHGRLLCREVL